MNHLSLNLYLQDTFYVHMLHIHIQDTVASLRIGVSVITGDILSWKYYVSVFNISRAVS